jgi:hypothetical protein
MKTLGWKWMLALLVVMAGVLTVSAVSLVSGRNSSPRSLINQNSTYVPPFRDGEVLRYEVYWKPLFLMPSFKAGELHFKLEESDYREKPVYAFKVDAISDGRLASVAGMDVRDYFESIVDRNNFRSYRMIKRIREGKRKRDFEMHFDYAKDHIHVRESDVSVTPPKELRNETIKGISMPLTDMISIFYVGRLQSMKQGDEFFVFLTEEGAARRIDITVGRTERVRTPIGYFNAQRIQTTGRVFRGGGNMRVWYSADDLRIPVRFEADVSFGKVYGNLILIESDGYSRGLIRSGD